MDTPPLAQPLPPAFVDTLDQIPLPIVAFDPTGLAVAYNSAAERFWQRPRARVVGVFNVFADPQSVANGSRETLARAIAGETFEREFDTRYEQPEFEGGYIWLRPTYFPIRVRGDDVSHVGVIYRDVTALIERDESIREAREALQAQGQLIQELSSPVAQIWEGIVFLPLVGAIDDRRATLVTEQLLTALVEFQADTVIIDIAGVPLIDTAVATYLLNTVRAAELLGSAVILVGIRGDIAQTIVHLGIDLSQLTTRANLQAGIAEAFARNGLEVRSRRG